MNVTQDELFLACGGLMWAYNLKRKMDPKTGKLIDPPLDKSNSLLIIKPDPFQMAFEPRSEEKRRQIIENWETAEATEAESIAAFEKTAALAREEQLARARKEKA